MAEAPLAQETWAALLHLAHQDEERVAVAKAYRVAKERATRDSALVAAQSLLAHTKTQVEDIQAKRRTQEAEIAALNTRMKRTQDRLASGALQSEREIHAAELEITSLKQQIAVAEELWLNASTDEDALIRRLSDVEILLHVEEREALVRQTHAQREAVAAEARLASIDQLRREAVKLIPTSIRDYYRAIYAKSGGQPFATLRGGLCGYCKEIIPSPSVQALRMKAAVPQCPKCGLLLLMR